MFKLPKISFKGILLALFVNWWWGFWRRKPKDVGYTEQELEDFLSEPVSVESSITIGDLIMSQMESVEAQSVPMSEQWNKRRVVIVEVGKREVMAIKAIRAITGVGLKEAKAFADEVEDYQILGPFNNYTPSSVLGVLKAAGCSAVIFKLDQDFDLIIEDFDEDDPVHNMMFEKLSGNAYFSSHQDNIDDIYIAIDIDEPDDDEDLLWLDKVDILDEDVLEDAPDDISFGHEDTELEPQPY